MNNQSCRAQPLLSQHLRCTSRPKFILVSTIWHPHTFAPLSDGLERHSEVGEADRDTTLNAYSHVGQ